MGEQAWRQLVAMLVVVGLAACGDRRASETAAPEVVRAPIDAPRGPVIARVDAAPPRSGLDDALVIACVGAWHSGPQVLKLWGDHPDYEADYATSYRTDDPSSSFVELRYRVDAGRLSLWSSGSAEPAGVPFTLERDEGDLVYRYLLRFDTPVLGRHVFEGEMPASYHCVPRRD